MTNRERFIELLRSTKREGIEGLILYLDEKTDMFTAPASVRYHGNYAGGLCEHCLNVYDNLVKLKNAFNFNVPDDSIIIVALLHDLAKVNFYEEFERNVKVDGTWVQQKQYKVRDVHNRFVYGSHEQTSVFIATQFIPLSIEEQVSIISHHGGVDQHGLHIDTVSDIYNSYTLPIYLHMADSIDAFKHE